MTAFEYVVGITGLISFFASHLLVGVLQMRRRARRTRLALRHN